MGSRLRSLVCGASGFKRSRRVILHRRPLSGILDVASEFFETEGPVRTEKEIGAPIVLSIFDAGENAPGFINSL
jgi:hypothetical protein